MLFDVVSYLQGDALPLSREACGALAANGGRPMLFALSQPGALSPEDAFAWTDGRCIFTDGQLVTEIDCFHCSKTEYHDHLPRAGGVLSPEDAFAWTDGCCILTNRQLVSGNFTIDN